MLLTCRSSVLLCLLAVAGCATTAVPTAQSGAPAADVHAFVVAPMTVVPSASGGAPWIVDAVLQADGIARGSSSPLGRIERDRVVDARGEVLLQLAPDGIVTLPWSTSAASPLFRFTPQGLKLFSRRGTILITVEADGAYARDGVATGARVTPYAPAHRDTALLLSVLPLVVLDRAIARTRTAADGPAR